jgi:hypothetical protein
MVKDLNVFPFDNDMEKAHFGTKLCIYHEKTVSVYQRNTIFTVYLKKSGNYSVKIDYVLLLKKVIVTNNDCIYFSLIFGVFIF